MLRILFVGINPGLRSAALGHHYAGPSNRFWKLLHEANLVPQRLRSRDDRRLPQWGLGLTNLVSRPTSRLADLTAQDLVGGRHALRQNIRRYRPRVVALLGITLYPALFPLEPKRPRPGLQAVTLDDARIVLLPNPSGRNAAYSYQSMLEAFRTLAQVGTPGHPQPDEGETPPSDTWQDAGKARQRRSRVASRLTVPREYDSPLGHWALTDSRPSADVTLILLRIADLAAALLDGPFAHPAVCVDAERRVALRASDDAISEFSATC